jgi:hypothetical protein
MATAQMDLATLAEMLLERLDSRWRRPDVAFSINVHQDTIVLSIAPADGHRKHRYVLKHRLAGPDLIALQRQGGLDDLAAAILRSADRFSNVVAA